MGDKRKTIAVVLAAGEGKRLRSDTPKVLHRVAGRPLVGHVLHAIAGLPIDRTILVVSGRTDQFEQAFPEGSGVELVVQDPPHGTADAVRVALEGVEDIEATVVVLPGDTPLIETQTIDELMELRRSARAGVAVLTAEVSDPSGYGRVVRTGGSAHDVERIVEDRDASQAERAIKEVNAGVYSFDLSALRKVIEKIDRENDQREYYLTDSISLLRDEGVVAHRTAEDQVAGVNSREQLAYVTNLIYARECRRLMENGVTIVDPSSTFVESSVEVGRDAVLLPFTFLEGRTRIGPRAEIGPQTRIVDSVVGEGATVTFSVVRSSEIGQEASVGPFASLRAGTKLGRGARLGTFVETKETIVGDGSKANHLAYLGDATIGSGVNVGAGTITCNWDGTEKHETVIDDDAYIGSDTMLVAPVRIGKRGATGAGSVVRDDVPEDGLAVGVPAKVIEGRGDKMRRKSGNDGPAPSE